MAANGGTPQERVEFRRIELRAVQGRVAGDQGELDEGSSAESAGGERDEFSEGRERIQLDNGWES